MDLDGPDERFVNTGHVEAAEGLQDLVEEQPDLWMKALSRTTPSVTEAPRTQGPERHDAACEWRCMGCDGCRWAQPN